MLVRVWTKMGYRLDICRVTKSTHIKSFLVMTVPYSWPVCHEFDPSTTEAPPYRSTVDAQCPAFGVEWKFGDGKPVQVLTFRYKILWFVANNPRVVL
ncbi:hypothetical protein TNCV_2225531 [Trichonephila clavipes]|nr:hypothetical protein TNCV_2225531 [Trichonephila clavipes]